MDIQFRAAKLSDVDLALPLMYSAAPEALDYLYAVGDKSAHDFLRFAFLEGKGLYGWRNHAVALVDDRVVGIGSFFSGQQYRALTQELMLQVLKFYPKLALPALSLRTFHMAQIIPPPPLYCHFLMDFGVDPAYQSRGIGSAFLHHHQAIAIELGRDSLGLDVSVTNHRAQALYERLGFEVLTEKQFKGSKGAVPDCRRMILSLN
ncbi:GNAT family N-acetyltransferase [Agitococcus lubricus]|uniref:Acetyltransferase (GNAT) family protein n=1 Tax=Agitococcus lubricus TaxID=1077255 RepID=A0A2T5IYD1_9GAMM|nr:N-acetyltransferase [Agitococcus lubricus]PTQ89014.1 acetyltransferase (GNAT) family protein [Agitococcus lubricus]